MADFSGITAGVEAMATLLLLCVSNTIAAPLCAADPVKDRAALRMFPLGEIRAEGWLKQNLERSKAGMGGHLDELEPELVGKPYVTRSHKPPQSPGWSAEIAGEYWTGLVELAFTLDDAELKEKARKWVDAFLAMQEPDGYLGTYHASNNRAEDYCAWGANWGFRALLAWHSATGDARVPEALHKGLLWFVDHWAGDKKTDYVGPNLIESMIACYHLTGDQRLVTWCREYFDWLDKHDRYFHCPEAFLRPELEYNDVHSVAFMEMVVLPLLQYTADGDERMRRATLNGIRQVKAKVWQCSGVPTCNDEHLVPPSCVHESEYCVHATTGKTFCQLARVTGDARHGDDWERAIFNAAQGARKADERAIAYMSSPNQFFATRKSSLFGCDADMEAYAPNYPIACCPAQSVRVYPEFVRGMFMRDAAGNVYAPVYGPCSLAHAGGDCKLEIREETMYPFSGKIVFHIKAEPAHTFALRLKAPRWNTGFALAVNGTHVKAAADAEGWLTLERTWENATVTLDFEMKPRVEPVTDVYFQGEPLRTVECGPLLYVMPIKTVWKPWPGTPLTPLPQGWSWYDAEPAEVPVYTLTKSLGTRAEAVARDTGTDYPWENPPMRVRIPARRAQERVYDFYRSNNVMAPRWRGHTPLPYGNPVRPDDGKPEETIELIPFGCANLRMACFTVER